MQLYTDCHQDLRLLDLRGLAPLDLEMVGAEMDLLGMIESHNARCARATARLRQLAEDRRCLGEFDVWRNKPSEALLAERARVRAETWDALWEARHSLEEREDVLAQVQQRLREQYDDAARQHDRAVEAAKRRLVKERRTLQTVNPSNAERHFHDLVAADESVHEAAKRRNAANHALNGIAEAKRGVTVDCAAVTSRQREVFSALVG